MSTETFDRSRLSVREDAILGHAIEGLTDQQIAYRMDIAVSTVNSYWVRIRGKLGQLSRTELVALALKQEAETERTMANAELEALRTKAREHARISADFANAEIYRAALDAMPEATLVACREAIIRYANGRLETMFGYGEGELVGLPVSVLLPVGERAAEGDRIADYMRDPHPMRVGLDRVVYGLRRNGERFRVVFLLDARPTSIGNVCACVVRDFTTEIGLRREYTSGWS